MSSQPPQTSFPLTSLNGDLPYRMTLAGGRIDQPSLSCLNPSPPGAVVVSLQPVLHLINRADIATSTRRVALKTWEDRLPEGDRAELVRELYRLENRDRPNPSGSQDMAGIIYPGILRVVCGQMRAFAG